MGRCPDASAYDGNRSWCLTVFGGIAIMMWLVPPREIERRLRLETEKPTFQRQKLNEALARF